MNHYQPPRLSNPPTKHFVSSLGKGLSVLECFARENREFTIDEVAALTGLSKASVSKLARTLSMLDYLRYDSDAKRYQLGLSSLPFSLIPSWIDLIRDMAMPLLSLFATSTGGVATIAIKSDLNMKYILVARPKGWIQPFIEVGTAVPLGRTASGLICLAAQSISSRHKLFSELAELEGGSHYLDNAVSQSVESVRELGYCTSASPWRNEWITVAAPLSIPGLPELPVVEWHGIESLPGSTQRASSTIGPQLQRVLPKIMEQICKNTILDSD